LGLGEVAIDAGEADIGDAVQPLEAFHGEFADARRGGLILAAGLELALDAGDQPLEPHRIDGALAAGDLDRAGELVAVERFARSAGFHHGDLAQLDALEGGKARRAAFALAAAADGGAIL